MNRNKRKFLEKKIQWNYWICIIVLIRTTNRKYKIKYWIFFIQNRIKCEPNTKNTKNRLISYFVIGALNIVCSRTNSSTHERDMYDMYSKSIGMRTNALVFDMDSNTVGIFVWGDPFVCFTREDMHVYDDEIYKCIKCKIKRTPIWKLYVKIRTHKTDPYVYSIHSKR